jgi:hypothetical protein
MKEYFVHFWHPESMALTVIMRKGRSEEDALEKFINEQGSHQERCRLRELVDRVVPKA